MRQRGWRRRSRPWAGWSAATAISSTGMTRAICARSTRVMFPQSIAAIWRGTSSCWPMRAANGGDWRPAPPRRAAASPTRSSWRVRRQGISFAAGSRTRCPGGSSMTHWRSWRQHRGRLSRTVPPWPSPPNAPHDLRRHFRWNAAMAPASISCSGLTPFRRRSEVSAAKSICPARMRQTCARASPIWRPRHAPWRWIWSLASCSIRNASCFRSATWCRKASSTPAATTC